MRTRILFMLLGLIIGFNTLVQAQSQGVNYQAVVRDGAGDPSANTNHTVVFNILQGADNGPSVYAETHAVTTNDFGLFSAVIGKGSVDAGSFSGIDWADDTYFLAVEIDGNAAGVSELEAVPYSKVATDMEIDALKDVNTGTPASGDVLSWDGSQWTADAPATGGSIWSQTGTTAFYDAGDVFVGRDFNITGAEYFGVGTPTTGNAYGGMYIETESATGRPFYGYATDGTARAWTYWDGNDSTWKLYNSGVQLVVDQNGNVGIGTSTPEKALDVDGDIRLNSAVGSLEIEHGGTGDGWDINTIGGGEDLQFFQEPASGNGELRVRYEQDGFVEFFNGSGGFSNEGVKFSNNGGSGNAWTWYPSNSLDNLFLVFNGTQMGYFNGTNGAYVQTSDRSLKKNIQAYAPVLSKVMNITPYTYHYVQNSENDQRSLGFIAQEVANDFPELVVESSRNGEEGEAILGVDYSGFSVVAIKAIQEQQAQIDEQQQLIELLLERVSQLEQSLND